MYVKTIRFTDFMGNVREEEHRFNLTESELIDMDLTTEGGIRQLLEKMTNHQDVPSLSRFFKEFIRASYGEISPDGRDFLKTNEIWEKFYRSNAYNELYMSLLTGEGCEERALEFIENVIPKIGERMKGNDRNVVAIERAKAMAQEKIAQQRGSDQGIQ